MKPFRVPSVPQRSISGISSTVKREKGQKGKDVEKTLHDENMPFSPKRLLTKFTTQWLSINL